MLTKVYLALGILIIGLYGWVAFTGKEFGDPDREKMPADVRQSPSRYRSFHVVGFHGGK